MKPTKTIKRTDEKQPAAKTHSFSPDRKGEASAGALASKDKKRSVSARRDGSNNR
jgi:hypothetical protein